MFKVEKIENNLVDEKRTIFHSFVIRAIFLTKLGRAGVQPAIYFLDLIVKETTNQYWMKLLRFLSDLKCTIDDVLTFEADDE